MKTYWRVVREVAQRIGEAIDLPIDALREGRIEQEPAFTDRMLGGIELAIDGFSSKGIQWTAKTLTDRGKGSQESIYGADFFGVLNINLPGFKVTKGFLAQAKLIKKGSSISLTELRQQCEKMLKLSPDSYVFLYRPSGVRVVPAIAVVGSTGSPLDLYTRSAKNFFEQHLECFIGDRAISAPTPATLSALSEKLNGAQGIYLGATADEAF